MRLRCNYYSYTFVYDQPHFSKRCEISNSVRASTASGTTSFTPFGKILIRYTSNFAWLPSTIYSNCSKHLYLQSTCQLKLYLSWLPITAIRERSFTHCCGLSQLRHGHCKGRAFQKSLPPRRLTAKAEKRDSAGRILPYHQAFY